MSAKVTVITRERTYKLKRSEAARKVRRNSLTYRWLDDFTVVEVDPLPATHLKTLFWDGLLGTGNLLPFAKVPNPMCKPETINYPVPAVGARARLLRCQTSLFFREALMENRAFDEKRPCEVAS